MKEQNNSNSGEYDINAPLEIHIKYAEALNETVLSNKIANDKFPQSKELTLNKKSLLYGTLTTLAFLGIAAILYFSSSKQSMLTSLIFVALSIPAGLITHYCAESSHNLSGTTATASGSKNRNK